MKTVVKDKTGQEYLITKKTDQVLVDSNLNIEGQTAWFPERTFDVSPSFNIDELFEFVCNLYKN